MINLIVATDLNNAIGKNGKMPWGFVKADLLYFKKVTMGHPVIMGRKTWESLPESVKPLPGRTNIVVSRNTPCGIRDGVYFVISIEDAIRIALTMDSDPFIIGGGQIYEQSMPYVERIFITRIDEDFEYSDTFFPEIDEQKWETIVSIKHQDEGYYPLSFDILYRLPDQDFVSLCKKKGNIYYR